MGKWAERGTGATLGTDHTESWCLLEREKVASCDLLLIFLPSSMRLPFDRVLS